MSKTSSVYKCLGNDTRLSMVREIARRGCEVSSQQILSSCSSALDLAQPTLSQHFSKLVSAGVLNERKEGVEKFYRLNMRLIDSVGIDTEKLKRGEI